MENKRLNPEETASKLRQVEVLMGYRMSSKTIRTRILLRGWVRPELRDFCLVGIENSNLAEQNCR